jgi:hypothetical protein
VAEVGENDLGAEPAGEVATHTDAANSRERLKL